jgi:hypothetical protein
MYTPCPTWLELNLEHCLASVGPRDTLGTPWGPPNEIQAVDFSGDTPNYSPYPGKEELINVGHSVVP